MTKVNAVKGPVASLSDVFSKHKYAFQAFDFSFINPTHTICQRQTISNFRTQNPRNMLGLICVQHMRVLDFRSEEKNAWAKVTADTSENYLLP